MERTAAEEAEVADILAGYGVAGTTSIAMVEALKRQPSRWVNFMMRFELGLEKRALESAFTIGSAYVAGALFPLLPDLMVIGVQPNATG